MYKWRITMEKELFFILRREAVKPFFLKVYYRKQMMNIANQIHVLRAYKVTAFRVESPFRAAPVITGSGFWVCAYDIIFKFAFYIPLYGRRAVLYIEESISPIHHKTAPKLGDLDCLPFFTPSSKDWKGKSYLRVLLWNIFIMLLFQVILLALV